MATNLGKLEISQNSINHAAVDASDLNLAVQMGKTLSGLAVPGPALNVIATPTPSTAYAFSMAPYDASTGTAALRFVNASVALNIIELTDISGAAVKANLYANSVSTNLLTVQFATGGQYLTYSDARLKTDVEGVSGALSTLASIRPVYYRWKDGRPTINPATKELGLLAQNVLAAVPAVVRETPDGILTVAYDRLASLLVAAFQELDARQRALAARLAQGPPQGTSTEPPASAQ